MPRDLWLTLWGFSVAFIVQIAYDLMGVFGLFAKMVGGCIIAGLILILLIYIKPRREAT
jgi:hypothetical protein